MSKTTDVLVIGSGLAGLMAALTAAKAGCRTRVVSEGMGCISIGGGGIDLLGYDNLGRPLANPWDGFANLDPAHPYALLGQGNIRSALNELASCLAARGLKLKNSVDENGKSRNFRMPTIFGTLKPTWLIPDTIADEAMDKAKRVLVLSVRGFRDCRPALIINQLRRYKEWADREFAPVVLPAPFQEGARTINALDLARYVDSPKGRDWLLDAVKGLGKDMDVALIPPMLGARPNSEIRHSLAGALGCPHVEMLSIPPGVAGMRMRRAFVDALDDLDVEFFENGKIVKAEVKDGLCAGLTERSTTREIIHHAKAVVVATGGIISGGLTLTEGKAVETVFGLEINVPEDVEQWTEPEIFGSHPVAKMGVTVDKDMRPLDNSGKACLDNVFFAGRTIGGYDYASEKSGYGVAVATGWLAGRNAAEVVKGAPGASGANI